MGETGHSTVVPVGPISSTKASTDPLHPNSMASQGSPSTTALAGVEEGGLTGAGGSRGDIQGSVTRETSGNKGEGVKMHTRGHRRGQRSRYIRMHVKGDIAVEWAGNSS